jgi:hypothetical protein
MDSPETIASRISEYIQTLPSKKISGTELAQFLKFAFPGFSPLAFGVPRLRVFLERYVPGIALVGRSGGDLLYGVKPPQEPEQQTETNVVNAPAAASGPSPHSAMSTSNLNHQLWKSFSSPNSLWHIYANTETGDIQVIAPGGLRLAAPWVTIPPCPPEVHLQVAKGFIATLSDEKQRDTLQGLIVQPRWWDRIYSVALQLGLLRNWQFYRRREILKAFSEALKSASIPIKQNPSIHSTPLQPISEQILPRETEQANPLIYYPLRIAVISPMQRMSICELRTLSRLVGYLADELRRDG